MSEAYEELIQQETFFRQPPTAAHEILVGRLHQLVGAAIPLNSALQILPPRTELLLGEHCALRPDLAVVRTEPGKRLGDAAQLYLVAEVLLPGDHHVDTVVK